MVVDQSPISGNHRPKSGRKPLQPKNSSSTPINASTHAKPKPSPTDWIEDDSNKENIAPVFSTPVKKESFSIGSFDASLADELSAIREKLERLRIDKEKTDKLLRERELMLDLQMNEVLQRGVLQKQLEIEVDRLYRLKEIKLSSMSVVSPLRSLREMEKEKKTNQDRLKAENESANREEAEEESGLKGLDTEVKREKSEERERK